ncbi:MAG: VanZ family protein, partial [Vicinamibacterales bacterium]
VVRIRDRRGPRYALIAAACVIGLTYSFSMAMGDRETDAVERVHLIEYGAIGWLFYRASKNANDLSSVILPVLAGLIAGTCDEWLQWFIPNRVGEARDVALNLVSVGCGLLFALGVEPPDRFRFSLSASSRRRVLGAAALAVLVFALLVNAVYVGHEVSREGLTFRSHYTDAELAALAADRAERWKTDPPIKLIRLSREDQYMDEALWHVKRRNVAWGEGDYWGSWEENRILETYYAPVLDAPSYVSPTGHRWPAAQRRDAESRAAGDHGPYVSHAEPYAILPWR